MKEIVIKSFEHLQEVVFKDCYDKQTSRYRNNFVYRGLPNSSYTLTTKLNRIVGHNLKLEDSIIRSFKKYGYADLGNNTSLWQTLATGQHFGLPTRLLDWSYSPLVAAHFATVDIEKFDQDGAIYCLDLDKALDKLPKCLKDELAKKSASILTISMLERHCKNIEELKNISKDPFVLFYEPASSEDRMANQFSLFSMSSDPNYRVDELVKKDCIYKIIIPSSIKLEIRDKLDYINISERMIYPGLDGICSWITRRYADLKNK